jgi:hypothetical protein
MLMLHVITCKINFEWTNEVFVVSLYLKCRVTWLRTAENSARDSLELSCTWAAKGLGTILKISRLGAPKGWLQCSREPGTSLYLELTDFSVYPICLRPRLMSCHLCHVCRKGVFVSNLQTSNSYAFPKYPVRATYPSSLLISSLPITVCEYTCWSLLLCRRWLCVGSRFPRNVDALSHSKIRLQKTSLWPPKLH